jgi:hypothetical protein
MIKLIDVDRARFEELPSIRQVIYHPHARRYAIAHLDEGEYGLSWSSNRIDPVVLEDTLTWIGVDQKLVALRQGRIEVSLPLAFPLLEILGIGQTAIVITELEILVFNAEGSFRFTKGLLDIAANWLIEGDQIAIELLSKTTLRLNLQNGKELSAIGV